MNHLVLVELCLLGSSFAWSCFHLWILCSHPLCHRCLAHYFGFLFRFDLKYELMADFASNHFRFQAICYCLILFYEWRFRWALGSYQNPIILLLVRWKLSHCFENTELQDFHRCSAATTAASILTISLAASPCSFSLTNLGQLLAAQERYLTARLTPNPSRNSQ